MHRGSCVNNGIKQEKLDSIVLEEVLKLANEETRKLFIGNLKQSSQVNSEHQMEEEKKHFNKLLSQFDRINTAYREGVDTLEEYGKKKSELIPQIESAREKIKIFERTVKKLGTIDWDDEYKEVLKRFLEHPTKESKQGVRVILTRLIERVEFRKNPFSVNIIYKTS